MNERPARIAHGYGNSYGELELALAQPVDMIEVDVWYGRGRTWVRHETPIGGFLPLVADRPRPPHTPHRFLRLGRRTYFRLDIGTLRLEQVMQAVNGRKTLLIDTKGEYRPPVTMAFAETLAKIIREHDCPVAVCGQTFEILDCFRKAAPEVEVRYSVERPDQWQRFVEMGDRGEIARRTCISHRFVDEEKASYMREKGVDAYCWTVDDAARASELVAAGASGIISNDFSVLAGL